MLDRRSALAARSLPGAAVAFIAWTLAAPNAQAAVVFATGFESGVPAQFAAPGAQIEGVQGCAGLGQPGNAFSGSLLRYSSTAIHSTTLTLANLPPHTTVTLGFLLAILDSWDGTELLQVAVDGNVAFSHWFSLAQADSSSYSAPPGGLLSRGHNLGWTDGSYYSRDRAYDLSVEPAFMQIPHTASTLSVVWQLSATVGGAAQNWQGGPDESWALDNVTVSVSNPATDALPAARSSAATLRGAVPNPFNPSTRLLYEVGPGGAAVTLRIYDLAGRLIRTLADGPHAGGSHSAVWDGACNAGTSVAAGVYLCRLSTTGGESTRKLTLVK